MRQVHPLGVAPLCGARFQAVTGHESVDHDADVVLLPGAAEDHAFVGPQEHPRLRIAIAARPDVVFQHQLAADNRAQGRVRGLHAAKQATDRRCRVIRRIASRPLFEKRARPVAARQRDSEIRPRPTVVQRQLETKRLGTHGYRQGPRPCQQVFPLLLPDQNGRDSVSQVPEQVMHRGAFARQSLLADRYRLVDVHCSRLKR